MFKLHTKCRACGNENLISVVDLGKQFPANNFTLPDQEKQGAAPLEVLFCERCTLAQLSVVYDPEILYSNYSYVTGSSPALLAHFEQLWSVIKQHSPAKSVLEIGSNTGEFLAYCKANGADSIMGFEPAMNLAGIANGQAIPTLHESYGGESRFIDTGKKWDVIIARHVFAHVDNWSVFLNDLDRDSGSNTTIVIEVPYVLDTLERCEFDQIYHEHLSYLSLKSMAALLKDSQFQMVDVRRFEIHGGAIAIFIKRKPGEVKPIVAEMMAVENITVETWEEFERVANKRVAALRYTVNDLRSMNRKMVGFGASAKSSVWIQSCGFDRNDIAFMCDNTPQKQGRISPGTDIPIVNESKLTNGNADYAILFAWNWAPTIMAKHQAWIDGGGKFILPHEL